ncbi:hypothetical protein EKO04_008587 [Ascochyta lentis]|uniref:Uncharacterized protein n=1 Tax=Ascochyta lentis TaxID=205686 RepID=A0A8H7IUR4_9PLEO|nr:hypothetical protein EKO04_008587 [Ascochyta lentis]
MTPSQTFSVALELPRRCQLPEHLYIIVDDIAFPTVDYKNGSVITPRTGDFHARQRFTCEDVSKNNLRFHIKKRDSSVAGSCFISTFENEENALRMPPFRAEEPIRSRNCIPHATKLIIDTSKLHAGWIDTSSGRVPVWLEHGELPKVPKGVLYMTSEGVEAFDASIWICIAEVRDILGLKPQHGEKGEWLACGHISRSMVEAQVVLHDYRGQRQVLQPLLPRRTGSIRSISSEEQDQHLKQQIARNKASKEDLRSRAVAKKQAGKKAVSLLKQAAENRQKQAECKSATEIPCRSSIQEKKLKQQSTFPLLSEPAGRTIVDQNSTRYASVRSPKLRQALERNQASKPYGSLYSPLLSPTPISQDKRYELEERLDLEEAIYLSLLDDFDSLGAGEGPSSPYGRDVRDRAPVEEDPYEQTLDDLPQQNRLPLRTGIGRERAFDEDRDTLPPSERLRRARAGKKRVGFVEPYDEVNDVLESVDRVSNTASVSPELVHPKVRFTLPEPPLSSEAESISDNEPHITDEDLDFSGDLSLDEGSASDPQTSASERAFGSRKSGKLSQHKSAGAHRSAPNLKLPRKEPPRPKRPDSKFFRDMGSDLDNDKPRYAKVDPKKVFGTNLGR